MLNFIYTDKLCSILVKAEPIFISFDRIQSTSPNKKIPSLIGEGVTHAVINTENYISPFSVQIPQFSGYINTEKGFLMKVDKILK